MKRKVFTKTLSIVLTLVMLLSLAACSHTPAETNESAEREAVVLKWLSPVSPTSGAEATIAAINKVLSERLNTTIELVFVDDYQTVVPTMVNASGDWDIALCGANHMNFATYARRGAFADITDYVDTYLVETKKSFSQGSWDAFSLEGKIMAVPIAKDLFDRDALIVNETLLEDIGVTSRPDGYATFWDIVDWLYEVKAARDAKYPEKADMALCRNTIGWLDHLYTFESLVGSWGACLIGANVTGYDAFEGYASGETVFCVPATEEYRAAMKMTRQLVEDGIIPPDNNEFDPGNAKFNAGELLLRNGLGMLYLEPNAYGDFEVKLYPSSIALTSSRSLTTGALAINADCEYIDRCLEVIEMLNSDVNLATTLHFGPEGEGWTDVDNDGVIELTEKNSDPSNRYWYNWYGWMLGCGVTTMKVIPGQPADLGQQMSELNRNATLTDNAGFIFDPTNVETELAACQAVYSEYGEVLKNGRAANVDEMIDEFVDKLYANGMDKVIDECQKQLTEWRAANGK